MEVPLVKRWLSEDEWYPVYTLRRNGDPEFEEEVQIPEDLWQRYNKAFAEFRAVQKILRSLNES